MEGIELKSFKLLSDLNMEKGFEIEELMQIEMKLEKLKIPATVINRIISEKYIHPILRHSRYCAYL